MTDELPDSLTEQQLQLGYWYVTQRLLLKKILTWVLVTVAILCGLYVFYQFLDWSVARGATERGRAFVATSRTQFGEFIVRNRPQNLEAEATKALLNADGASDLLATVNNPNQRWAAYFDYSLTTGDVATPARAGFLMPLESRPLAEFSAQIGTSLPDIKIDNIRWVWISPHHIPDYTAWSAERINFEFGPVATSVVEVAGKRHFNTSFTVTNKSSYGYWELPLLVILGRGEDVTVVSRVVLDRVAAGEKREVRINWLRDVPGALSAQVVPALNLLDSRIYMVSTAPPQIDVREQP